MADIPVCSVQAAGHRSHTSPHATSDLGPQIVKPRDLGEETVQGDRFLLEIRDRTMSLCHTDQGKQMFQVTVLLEARIHFFFIADG